MIEKVKGIVLQRIAYTDNKNIVKIYTETGSNSYMCFRKSKNTHDALQPMTLVQFCSEKRQGTSLSFLRDVQYLNSVAISDYQLPKATINMFLNEILYKLLGNAGEDSELFDFVFNTLHQFYNSPYLQDFHLRFLVHCAIQMGSAPKDNYQEGCIFDVLSANFVTKKTIAVTNSMQKNDKFSEDINVQVAQYLYALMQEPLFPQTPTIAPFVIRNALLNLLIEYYTIHIIDLSGLQSLEVLQTILHE